jgi:hypothetical protein
MDRERDQIGGDDENRLPEHEYKDPNTVGAGVMSTGGTAVERGTSQIDPSGEDSRAEPGEIAADTDAADAYAGVATPGDLLRDRDDDAPTLEEIEDVDEGKIPPQAPPQM